MRTASVAKVISGYCSKVTSLLEVMSCSIHGISGSIVCSIYRLPRSVFSTGLLRLNVVKVLINCGKKLRKKKKNKDCQLLGFYCCVREINEACHEHDHL